MAIYICKKCEQWMDDDYSPMQDLEVCPECDLEMNAADRFSLLAAQEIKAKGSVSKKTMLHGFGSSGSALAGGE